MKRFFAGTLVVALFVVLTTRADEEAQKNSSVDACANVVCHRGLMCVAENDLSTTCVCPESCPKVYDPLCSVYNREFNSTCEMHKFACHFGFFTGVKHKGLCTAEESVDRGCPIDRLLDFHERYLAWLMIAYNEDNNIPQKQDFNFDEVADEERKKLIEWEFTSRDINHNGHLDLKEIKAMVDEREPCMVALLSACDFDGEPGVSHHEWNSCFPIKLQGLEEQFSDDDL